MHKICENFRKFVEKVQVGMLRFDAPPGHGSSGAISSAQVAVRFAAALLAPSRASSRPRRQWASAAAAPCCATRGVATCRGLNFEAAVRTQEY